MSDAQYKVNRTDYSLIPDFIGYRNATPKVEKVITVEDNQITTITNRLTTWYLGSGQHSSERWIKMRTENEKTFIRNGVKAAQKIKIQYTEDHTPQGEPLFPMGAPTIIDGQEAKKFRSINENILLPLALDYRKNQNDQSLKKHFTFMIGSTTKAGQTAAVWELYVLRNLEVPAIFTHSFCSKNNYFRNN